MSDLNYDKAQGGSLPTSLRPRVMIVDDEPSNIRILADALQLDYELIIANNSFEALRILQNGDVPHLILLDIMMPGMDGYSLCRKIKSSPGLRNVPVIFLTALTDTESEEKGFDAGAVDYIGKPIRLSTVRARVRTHISLRGMLDHLFELNQELCERIRETVKLNGDLHERDQRLGEANADRNLFESVFTATSEGICVLNAAGEVLTVNPSFERITGFAHSDVVGRCHTVLDVFGLDNTMKEAIWQAVQTSGHWTGEIYNRRKSGEVYPELRTIRCVRADSESPPYYVTIFTDISNIKETEQRLEELTWRDPITGLPNRALFLDQLGAVLKYCHSSRITSAAIVLDMKGFRSINDSYGYKVGDMTIREIARRLEDTVGEDDTVARLGGDEFAILLAPTRWDAREAYAQAQILAERVLCAFSTPLDLPDSGRLPLDMTLGVVLLPSDQSVTASQVLQQAETAHHIGKRSNQPITFFSDSMSERAATHVKRVSELVEGLERGELILFGQPQYAPNKTLCGLEILARWQHPEEGILGPAAFIPVAEESGLIVRVERAIIEKTLEYLPAFRKRHPHVRLSVNISAKHFAEPDFVQVLLEMINQSECEASDLILELTESAMVHDIGLVAEKMNSLRSAGCEFSLDDFGTGYSSLSYLRQLPFSEIKIDRSFVMDAPEGGTSADIVEMIVKLGETLKTRVVAEGVENREHVRFFDDRYPNVNLQGYYFAKPEPVGHWLSEPSGFSLA
ncbi:EAL domain-containing protein [Marinobacter oulmenensis]|uniref:Diguanylate cyclase (GGDEF)-like protein/PAS domain S-box-containing protein n=1 Tax=Marinobacter oulmenensis TaxID=643747 RepID=A0A840UB83_9GAMM|nr:diguanylate cyclase (GGDEF)-like protein/PAS domain S-box-containing protein [Marinobacter oulmenensis]